MKKTILLLFFVSIFLLVTGCKKDEVEAIPDETTSGGWEIILSSDQIVSNNDALEAYNKAKEIYVDEDFDLVALLAKQIVAGTNYMYLVKNEKEYKILVVYNDLDGNKKTIRVREEIAIAFQHEIDHLNGILFTDKIDPKNPYKNKEKMREI